MKLYEVRSQKRHFLFSGHKYKMIGVNIRQTKIGEREKLKLLGIIIDKHLF